MGRRRYFVRRSAACPCHLFPGWLFGDDRYNPWTATVHLYSDVPAIALPIYAGTVVAGHVAGRIKAKDVDTTLPAPSWESEASRGDDEIPAVALEPLTAIE